MDKIKWLVSDFRRSKKDNFIAAKVEAAMVREYLNQGLNVLMEKSFTRKEYLLDILKIAKAKKVRALVYQLEAPRKTLLKRLKSRPKNPAASKAVPQTRILTNLRIHAKHKYDKAIILDSSKLEPKALADIILRDIKNL